MNVFLSFTRSNIGILLDDFGPLAPDTLAIAAKVDPLAVVAARRLFLEYLIQKDPSQEKFRKGWMNRLESLELMMMPLAI